MGRPSRDAPRINCEQWPDQPCDDPVVEEVRRIAVRLRAALDETGLSLRAVAARADTTHNVLAALLEGRAWPEVATVVRLERALDTELWVRESPE